MNSFTAQRPEAGAHDHPKGSAGIEPHRETVEDVLAALGSDSRCGLSDAEAASRLARFGPNQLESTKPIPAWRKFLAQFTDVLVVLLIIAGVISAVLWVVEGLPVPTRILQRKGGADEMDLRLKSIN